MLTITIPVIDQPAARAKALLADRRLYLARDESTMIEAGDERAAFLLAPAGGSIPGPEVERLKLSLVDGRVMQEGAESIAEPIAESDGPPAPPADEAKQSSPEEDKQDTPDDTTHADPDADKQAAPQGDKSDKTKREKK